MIAIDASAILALARDEPEDEPFRELIGRSQTIVGAPTLFEARMVLSKLAAASTDRFIARLLGAGGVEAVSFSPDMVEAAIGAFRRFGKGQGHPAQLNFGDCMAYAVAKVRGVPLLYKGEDFARTDIEAAWRP